MIDLNPLQSEAVVFTQAFASFACEWGDLNPLQSEAVVFTRIAREYAREKNKHLNPLQSEAVVFTSANPTRKFPRVFLILILCKARRWFSQQLEYEDEWHVDMTS